MAKQINQPRLCPGFTAVGGGKKFAVVRLFNFLGIPVFKSRRRPGGIFVGVANITGVGGAKFFRQVWPRDTYAVIATGIDHHEMFDRHMAFHAGGAGGLHGVMMVFGGMVFTAVVATQAKGVAGRMQFQAVWIVAIVAAHAVVVHLALHERSVDVDLLFDLAIVVIEAIFKYFGLVRIEKFLPVDEGALD